MSVESDIQALYLRFSLNLRTRMEWDRDIFDSLFREMKRYCEEVRLDDVIDRKTAAIFWNASWWVKAQVDGLPEFSEDYYQNAIVNLDHLAWALFESDIRDENNYEPL